MTTDAKEFLRPIASEHTPSNARRYTFVIIESAKPGQDCLIGAPMDHKPFEGKVVGEDEDWIAVKTGRTEFKVLSKKILKEVPALGSKVKVTPYSRMDFDGRPLNSPKVSSHGGYSTSTFVIGNQISRLPIDKATVQSEYLLSMIQQIEEITVMKKYRTIAQAILDAGHTGPVEFVDPTDAKVIETPPRLTFKVNSGKHKGFLSIWYERAIDYYVIELLDENKEIIKKVESVDFMSLPELVVDLVDDGEWQFAKVELIGKPAKLKKAA